LPVLANVLAILASKKNKGICVMENKFCVVVHTGIDDNGTICYDLDTKKLEVNLADKKKANEVYMWLTVDRVLHRYTGLLSYETIHAVPTENVDTLKLALGYMWRPLDVHVDWSRPIEAYL